MSELSTSSYAIKVVSQHCSAKLSCVRIITAGNSIQLWKLVKLFNGRAASTIPVINHDGKSIDCNEWKANTQSLIFFHSCFETTMSPLSSDEGSSYEVDPAACPRGLYC